MQTAQSQLLGKLDDLMSGKLDNFRCQINEKQRQLSGSQAAKIEQINHDHYKFNKCGNEEQFKTNVKVEQKMKEAASLSKKEPELNKLAVQEKNF